MLKVTKYLSNNKTPACESRGFVRKKNEGVHFDTPSTFKYVKCTNRLSPWCWLINLVGWECITTACIPFQFSKIHRLFGNTLICREFYLIFRHIILPCFISHLYKVLSIIEFFDFGEKSPASGGQVGSCRTKDFLSDKDTTCSVRLNRESSFVGLLRDVHGVLWSGEVSSFPLSDSGFAKLDSDNRLVNSAWYDIWWHLTTSDVR